MSKGKPKINLEFKVEPEIKEKLFNLAREQRRDASEILREATYWIILEYEKRKENFLKKLEQTG